MVHYFLYFCTVHEKDDTQQLKIDPNQVQWKSPFSNLSPHDYLRNVTHIFKCIEDDEDSKKDTDQNITLSSFWQYDEDDQESFEEDFSLNKLLQFGNGCIYCNL